VFKLPTIFITTDINRLLYEVCYRHGMDIENLARKSWRHFIFPEICYAGGARSTNEQSPGLAEFVLHFTCFASF